MKNKGYQILSLSMILIAIAMLGTAIYIISNDKKDSKDYASGDTDSNAVPIGDKNDNSSSSGGSKVSLDYKNKVVVDLKKKKIDLYIQNPARSNQNMIVEIMASNPNEEDSYFTISKSGTIPNGYGIYELSLIDDVELKKGDYSGKFVVSFYDIKTLEKAAFSTNIPILIEVK